MSASIDLVREFHAAFGQADAGSPRIDNEKTNDLRISLLDEELDELAVALCARDPVAVLDALTDLQYVLDGAYLQLGFADVKDAALAEVHRSNMSKLGADGKPVHRADGKILKGPNYSPPDLKTVLAKRDRIARFNAAHVDTVIVDIAALRPDPVATFDVSGEREMDVLEVVPPGACVGEGGKT